MFLSTFLFCFCLFLFVFVFFCSFSTGAAHSSVPEVCPYELFKIVLHGIPFRIFCIPAKYNNPALCEAPG